MMAASVVGKGITGKYIESRPVSSPSPHSSSLHEPFIATPPKVSSTCTTTKSTISNVVTSDEESCEGSFEDNDQLSSLSSSAGKSLALSSPLGREASPVLSISDDHEDETNIALSQLKELDTAIKVRKLTKVDGRKTRWIEYRKTKQTSRHHSSLIKKLKKESPKLQKFKSKRKIFKEKECNDLSFDINKNASPLKSSDVDSKWIDEVPLLKDDEKEVTEKKEYVSVVNNNNNNNINNNNKNTNNICSKNTVPVFEEDIMKVEPTSVSDHLGTTDVLETMKQHFLQGTVNAPVSNGIKEKTTSTKKSQKSLNGSVLNESLKRKRGRPRRNIIKVESKDENSKVEVEVKSDISLSSSASPISNASEISNINGNGFEVNIKLDLQGMAQTPNDFYSRKNFLTKGLREVRKSESGSESGASSPEKNVSAAISPSTPLPVSPISQLSSTWLSELNNAGPTKCPLISAAAKMLSTGHKKLGTTYGIAAKKKNILKKLSKKENIYKKENIFKNGKANGHSNNQSVKKKNLSSENSLKTPCGSSKTGFAHTKRGRGRPRNKADSPSLKWTKKISTVIADVHNTMNGEPQTVITANNSIVQKNKKSSNLKKTPDNELDLSFAVEENPISDLKENVESANLSNNLNGYKPTVPALELATSSSSPNSMPSQMPQSVFNRHSASKVSQSSHTGKSESTKQKVESVSAINNSKKTIDVQNTLNSSTGNLEGPSAISNKIKDRPKTLPINPTNQQKLLQNSKYNNNNNTGFLHPNSCKQTQESLNNGAKEKISKISNGNPLIQKKTASTIIVSTAEAIKKQIPQDKRQRIVTTSNELESNGVKSKIYESKQIEDSSEILNVKDSEIITGGLSVKELPFTKMNNSVEKISSKSPQLKLNSSTSKLMDLSASLVTVTSTEELTKELTSIKESVTVKETTPAASGIVTPKAFAKSPRKALSAANASFVEEPLNTGTGIITPKPPLVKGLKKTPEKLIKSKSLNAVIEKLHSPNAKKLNSIHSLISPTEFSLVKPDVKSNLQKSVRPMEKKEDTNLTNTSGKAKELQNSQRKSLIQGYIKDKILQRQNSFGAEGVKIAANDKKVLSNVSINNVDKITSNEKKCFKQGLLNSNAEKVPTNDKKIVPLPILSNNGVEKLALTESKTVKHILSKSVPEKVVTIEKKIVKQINNLNEKKVVKQNISSNVDRVNSVENKIVRLNQVNIDSEKNNTTQNDEPTIANLTVNSSNEKSSSVSKIISAEPSVKPKEKDISLTANVPVVPPIKPKEKVPRFLKQLFQDEGVQNMLRSVNEEAASSSLDGSPSVDGSSHKLRPKRVNENFSSDTQETEESYYLSNAKRKRRGTEVDNLYLDEGALNMLTSLDTGARRSQQSIDDAASDTSQESSSKVFKVSSGSQPPRKRRLSGSATSTGSMSQPHEPKKQRVEEIGDANRDTSPLPSSSENQRLVPAPQGASFEKRKPGRPSLPVALKQKAKLQLQIQLKKQLQRLGIQHENLNIAQMKEILTKMKVVETFQKKSVTVPPLKIKLPAPGNEKLSRSDKISVESTANSARPNNADNENIHKPNRIFKTLDASYLQGTSEGIRINQPVRNFNDKGPIPSTSLKRILNIPKNIPNAPLQSLLRPHDASLSQGQRLKSRSTQEGIRQSQRASVRHTEGGHYRDIALRRFNNFMQIILTPSTTKMKNALNSRVLRELCEALNMLRRDESVRMVVLTATGSTFCQGIDLTSLQNPNPDTRKKNAENLSRGIKDFLRALAQFPKMLVAGVNGNAMGLGVTILPLFDMVFASDKAEFFLPYAKLGQVPEGGATYTFPYYYGKLQSNKMFFGQKITASQAQQMGLISESLWPETFFQELLPKVALLATQSPQSMEGTKALVNHHIITKLELSVESECRLLLQHWMSPTFSHLCKRFFETAEIQFQKPVNLPL